MKVKHIIEYLKELDPDTELYASDGTGNGYDKIFDIQGNVIMYGWYVEEVLKNIKPN